MGGSSTDNGAPIVQMPCSPDIETLHWRAAGQGRCSLPDGSVNACWKLVNHPSEKCIGVAGGSPAMNTLLVQWQCQPDAKNLIWQLGTNL